LGGAGDGGNNRGDVGARARLAEGLNPGRVRADERIAQADHINDGSALHEGAGMRHRSAFASQADYLLSALLLALLQFVNGFDDLRQVHFVHLEAMADAFQQG